jgi:hypothetical protein
MFPEGYELNFIYYLEKIQCLKGQLTTITVSEVDSYPTDDPTNENIARC